MHDNWINAGKQCLQDEANALLGLVDHIDANFEKAVKIILDCKGKLIVTGVGKSGHIGAKIAATLSSTGTPSFFVNPLDVFHGDLGVITQDDVVLAISNSGQTDELLRFLPYLIDLKISVVGMSGNPESKLSKYATVHLNTAVPYETGRLGLAPTSSTTAQLAMGDALACALMEARHFAASDFAHFHPGGTLGKRLLTKSGDVMRSTDLPLISPDSSMQEALVVMSNGRLGMCIALHSDNTIAGILTDGDLRRAIQQDTHFFTQPVSRFMTSNPVKVNESVNMAEVEEILLKNKIHCVLVADETEHLLGVVDSFALNV